MKLHFAYSLLGLSFFLVVTNIVLKQYVLIKCNCIMHNGATHDNTMQRNNVDYVSAMHSIINPQEFVFCSSAILATFENKKKERTQHLFEELCGIKRTTTCSHSFLTRAASRTIAVRNYVCGNKQQFGIPAVATNDCALQRCMLAKQIASQLMSEKDTLSQQQCRLCALEKLLK